MSLSILTLENEVSSVNKIKAVVSSLEMDNKIHSFYTVDEAVEAAKMLSIDIYIVNINLSDLDPENTMPGVAFIQELRKSEKLTPVIAIGSLSEMPEVVTLFNDLNVFAYLDKTTKNDIFKQQLIRALEFIDLAEINNRVVAFKRKSFIRRYPVKDLICIQRVPHGKKQILVTAFDEDQGTISTEKFAIKSSLGEVLKQFTADSDVIRVHQSWVINPKMIRGFDLTKEELILVSNVRVPIGDTYKHLLKPYV